MPHNVTQSDEISRSCPLPLFPYDLATILEFLPSATVLPEQFHGRADRTSAVRGEVELMRAVLFDAVECFRKYTGQPSNTVRRRAYEAAQWLFADDDRWPFSFVNICAVLGLSPAYVRQGLRRWKQATWTCPTRGRLQQRAVRRSSSLTA
jgi:hypothetical protein